METSQLMKGIEIMRKIQDDNQKKRLENHRENMFADVPAIYDIPYMSDESGFHRLNIYGSVEEKLPVIIEIHGGGYISCDKSYNELHGRFLARNGFKVCNINYTLQPEGNFITEIQEFFTALDWIVEHQDQYGFDTHHIYLTGDSAGGHLALLIGAVLGSEHLQEYFGVKKISASIGKIAASCPAFDGWLVYHSNDRMTMLSKAALFGQEPVDQTYINNISIDKLLDQCRFPDMFLLTTPSDELLYSETKRLHEIFVQNNIRHTYKEYVGQENKLEHVFNVLYPEYEESVAANMDILAYFRKQ